MIDLPSIMGGAFAVVAMHSIAQTLPTSAAAKTDVIEEIQGSKWSSQISWVSQYRYRGIAQTSFRPTLQADLELKYSSGWYVGAWGTGAQGKVELDLYAGRRFDLKNDWNVDTGLLRYTFVGHAPLKVPGLANTNTTELYAGLSKGPWAINYSRSIGDYFGVPDTTGSSYFDVTATFYLGNGWGLVGHMGRQILARHAQRNYTDYMATLGKDFGHRFSGELSLTANNADATAYPLVNGSSVAKKGVVFGLKYRF